MDRLCSIIVVLLLTAGALSTTEQLKVILEPTHIKVCEGASVTINCTFQLIGKYKVRWYFSQTPILDRTSAYRIPEEQRYLIEKKEDWSTLNIPFIKANESGWYFCEVTQDIPILIQSCSNATKVEVDAPSTSTSSRTSNTTAESQDPTQNQTTGGLRITCSVTTVPPPSPSPPSFTPWWIWLALAVGCVVLLVSIVVACILSRKPKETIYENTKPVESSCWRRNRTKTDICDLPASKKTDTIKPLRKYDTLSSNRIRRP